MSDVEDIGLRVLHSDLALRYLTPRSRLYPGLLRNSHFGPTLAQSASIQARPSTSASQVGDAGGPINAPVLQPAHLAML